MKFTAIADGRGRKNERVRGNGDILHGRFYEKKEVTFFFHAIRFSHLSIRKISY
jgi:hypothetical protein